MNTRLKLAVVFFIFFVSVACKQLGSESKSERTQRGSTTYPGQTPSGSNADIIGTMTNPNAIASPGAQTVVGDWLADLSGNLADPTKQYALQKLDQKQQPFNIPPDKKVTTLPGSLQQIMQAMGASAVTLTESADRLKLAFVSAQGNTSVDFTLLWMSADQWQADSIKESCVSPTPNNPTAAQNPLQNVLPGIVSGLLCDVIKKSDIRILATRKSVP